jgi:hypothetical protein
MAARSNNVNFGKGPEFIPGAILCLSISDSHLWPFLYNLTSDAACHRMEAIGTMTNNVEVTIVCHCE